MNPKQRNNFYRNQRFQQGLSLVELMIALALGVFLIWGVTQSFLTSKQLYRTQQGLARIQENGRMAQELIGYDIRNAGDYGCGSSDEAIHGPADMRKGLPVQNPALPACASSSGGTPGINMLNDITKLDNEYEYAVYGFNNVTSPATTLTGISPTGSNVTAALNPEPKAGTDVLMVHISVDIGTTTAVIGDPIVPTMANMSSLTLNTSNMLKNGASLVDRIAVSDCATTKVFGVTDMSSASTTLTLDSTENFCTYATFQNRATVRKLNTVYYYVADNNRGGTSLYRQISSSGTTSGTASSAVGEELLEGVEDMQLEFGIDNTGGGDGVVDEYKPANDLTGTDMTTTAAWSSAWNGWDWWAPNPTTTVCDKTTPTTQGLTCPHKEATLVRSVRYMLLMRSADPVLTEPQTISFNGAVVSTATTADRRLRQVFSSTVGIRSRQIAP